MLGLCWVHLGPIFIHIQYTCFLKPFTGTNMEIGAHISIHIFNIPAFWNPLEAQKCIPNSFCSGVPKIMFWWPVLLCSFLTDFFQAFFWGWMGIITRLPATKWYVSRKMPLGQAMPPLICCRASSCLDFRWCFDLHWMIRTTTSWWDCMGIYFLGHSY